MGFACDTILLHEFQVRYVAVDLRYGDRGSVAPERPLARDDDALPVAPILDQLAAPFSSILSSASISAIGRGNSVLSNSCDVFPIASAALNPYSRSMPPAQN